MSRQKFKPTELMRAMGSKTGSWDPEPPDLNKYCLYHGTPRERAIAWVKSKTTAKDHNSPFAVNEHGKPLYLESLAADLGWSIQTARNVMADAETEGLVRLEKGKKIWLCADVPYARKKEMNNSVHSCCPTYLLDSIRGLPEDLQAAVMLRYEQYLPWKREFEADAMGAARKITEQIEDSIWQEFGLEKKRLPKRRPAEAKHVQLSLIKAPDFVQSCSPESVQTPQNGSYKPGNGSVQNGASLLIQTQTQTTPLAAAAFSKEDLKGIQDALSEYGLVAAAAVKALAQECRKQAPDCTAVEVVAVIQYKASKMGKPHNPIGLLLNTVPSLVPAALPRMRRQAKPPTSTADYTPLTPEEIEELEGQLKTKGATS